MTGLKNFFEVFIAVGSWHSYFASPEPESSPSTHSFCNVSQSHLQCNINNAFNPLQSFKNCQLNSVLEVNFLVKTKQYTTNIHVLQPQPFVFHCGINKRFRWVSYIFFWSEIHLHQLALQHSAYADIQQHHILSFPSQCSRGSLKETKRNTFVTSHVLHVRASLYMSKLSDLRTKVVLRLVMST